MTAPPVIPKNYVFKGKPSGLAKKLAYLKTRRAQRKIKKMSNNQLADYAGKITSKKTKKSNNKTSSVSMIQVGNRKQSTPQQAVVPKQSVIPEKPEAQENASSEDNIKPLGSPGMYGMIVLGLFGFASYLQFSAFNDKQTFGN